MQLVIAGLHQRTAPVAIRERLAFGPEELCGALQTLRRYADEGYIVSTCNRVEVCGLFHDAVHGDRALGRFLSDWHFLPIDQIAPHLYVRRDGEAIRHVFRLAAGLDSMVLGEDQILGQLKSALANAHAAGSIGNVLHRLLHTALATGKLVRTRTAISQNHLSVVSVALDLARQSVGDLSEQRYLVVGAGQMAELTLKHLRAAGARKITVTSRKQSKARRLAAGYGAGACAFEERGSALGLSDVVISCTSAPGAVIDAPMTAAALSGRAEPLLLLDLAVPRDVDRAAADVPGATLFDIDDMQAVAAANRAARAVEAAHAERIVVEEVEKFEEWLATQRVVPTIRALRERAEEIRHAEIQRTLARCPELSEAERAAIEALTASIVNKLLHHPIVSLKDPQEGHDIAEVVHRLFQLPAGSCPHAADEVAGEAAQ